MPPQTQITGVVSAPPESSGSRPDAHWMSHEMEVPYMARLATMMRGETAQLDAAAQTGVAAWCYKTMAMALFRGSPAYAGAGAHPALNRTHEAPKEATVLVGRFVGPSELLIDGYSQRFDLSPTPDPRDSSPDEIMTGELFKVSLGGSRRCLPRWNPRTADRNATRECGRRCRGAPCRCGRTSPRLPPAAGPFGRVGRPV